MSEAKRDQNHVPTALGVSSVDGVTTLPLQVDPVTGRLLTDVAGGGTGTVTSVSVVSANGLAGTVATATTTPAITLSTTITGVLKGNGTAISAATDGTDYLSSTTGLKLDQTSAQTIANDSPIFGALTASELVATTAAKKLQSLTVATYPSLTELSYVKGVTSAIQAQINAKGTGNVTKVGTPVDNQIGVWTGDGTIEGGASLTYDGTNLNLATAKNFQIAGATVLADAAGTTTLSNIDAVDATTEATIEAAIDTLNNLTLTGTPQVLSTDAGATGPEVDVYHNSASPAANDVLGKVTFNGKDSATNKQEYANIKGVITSPTSTSEQGQITFGMVTGGTVADRITFYATSVVPVTNDAYALGSTSNQFSDLFLAEGGVINWDNGDATLTQVGNMVTLAGADLTVPNLTVGAAGAITLSENASIALDPAGSADGKYTGITITGTAGAALAFGDLCYLDPTDSRWELADANAAAAADGDARGILGICVLAAAGDGSATTMLLEGVVRADTAFPSFTINNPIYVSETAGDVTQTQPTTTDVVIRIVGSALTADEMYFNPDWTWTTHT